MVRTSLSLRLKSLVSLEFAPSFVQPPEKDAIGVSVKKLPWNAVTAYVTPEVITKDEERALLEMTKPWFNPLPFNDGHVDGLIHHYKEFYRSYNWLSEEVGDKKALSALKKARSLAEHYLPHIPVDDRVHFLRLERDGFIRAHIDENRNSSGLIGGLCLGSGRIMTLTHPKHPKEKVQLLLAPRCFYAIIGRARYDWEHSVDWVKDDQEHLERIRKIQRTPDSKIVFNSEETEYYTGTRTAIIFRGISPMDLLQRRLGSSDAS